ncbi:protein kinase domain-containing protein [Roseimaritima ulvae]|uniref:Serine/threonine-protein kinase PknB n=1 Tax=Roseimaritima ulvae TaxID=980254 RepID=A0A5B9R5E8_9BACT|nr:serine/threonine-protein kinase [Roseimaritima ulvae]QEG41731.1 Serine/threonine-protein kinase PknB [Roseimaritima ulvae]
MSLSQLSAAELARIDSICLRFEAELKAGQDPCIQKWMDEHPDVDREVLQAELAAVRAELSEVGQRSTGGPEGDPCREGVAGLEPGESVIRPGAQLGPYKVESLIGRGGMGRVYLGLDTRLDRAVAIKVLADDWAQRQDRVERFERESRAVAAMRHPNIVSLFDIGSHCGRPYAVMEWLDGETLRDRIKRGPINAAETRHIGAQAAEALAAAHANGIVHRDLKPENLVLIGPLGKCPDPAPTAIVKLLDFGLSRASQEDLDGSQDPTASGIVMGTAGYMAPEQARGEKATFAADIFGLGCVLHECFYHRPPFPGKTLAESLGAVLHADPKEDAEIAASDPDLAEVIRRCLRKQPEDRPRSAAEVSRWLRSRTLLVTATDSGHRDLTVKKLEAGETLELPSHPHLAPALPGPPTTLSRRRLGMMLVAAAAVGGAAWWRWGGESPRIESLAVLPLEVKESQSRQPLGARTLSDEEMVAAMLVNQLARQQSLKVVPFRPIRASSPQYAQVGKELGVDGLVLVQIVGQGQQRRVHLQLVEADSSAVLWGKEFQYSEGASLLTQRDSAARIAQEIGIQVASIRHGALTEEGAAFSCLVRGEARLDPDSEDGLRGALGCFDHARQVDPLFAEAHAGFALSAMTLAALSPPEESQELVVEARSAMLKALELRPDEGTTNLAAAMINWRDDRNFESAERHFQKTLKEMPNSWHAQHEYALFASARRQQTEAIAAIRRAVTLNPLSQTLRVDEARLNWFDGQPQLAKPAVDAMLADADKREKAAGLAIDQLEQTEDYDAAAALQDMTAVAGRADLYFAQRQAKLDEYPYGPFGPTMNQAILDARLDRIDDTYLAELISLRPTTLVLLMSAHPAFAGYRDRPIAEQVDARLPRAYGRSPQA